MGTGGNPWPVRTMAPHPGSFDAVASTAPKVDALAHIEWLRPQVVETDARAGAWAALAVLVALAAVAVGGLLSADPIRLDPDALTASAFELQVDGRVSEAAGAYRAAIALDPANTVAHFNLGVLHHTSGATVDAAASYEAALASDPSYAPALFNLALLKEQLGDATSAIDLYRRLLASSPDHAAANLNLGVLLLEQGDDVEGSELINRAISIDPSLQLP